MSFPKSSLLSSIPRRFLDTRFSISINQRYISANTPKSNETAIYLSQRYIPNNVTLKRPGEDRNALHFMTGASLRLGPRLYFENGPLEPGYPKGCRQYSNEMSVLQDSNRTYKIKVRTPTETKVYFWSPAQAKVSFSRKAEA